MWLNHDRARELAISPARRRFLANSVAWTASAGAFALSLQAIGAASAQSTGDFKALVCVFLYGGNDHANTVTPYGVSEHALYARGRGDFGVRARTDLLPIAAASISDGRQVAFPRELAGLKALYDQRKAAVVANVGPLLYPITKAQFLAGSVPAPPQLLSHNDHANFWQSGVPSYAVSNGWGGRMADLLGDLNANATVAMGISTAGANLFQVGEQSFSFPVSSTGQIRSITDYISQERLGDFERVLAQQTDDPMKAELARTYLRGRDAANAAKAALARAPDVSASFSVDQRNPLTPQLQMVARLIAVRNQLGHRRQIYFVTQGGYDTHGDLNQQPLLLQKLDEALVGFHRATVALGVENQVTTFTASDFGRRLATNGGGSDHGWGGHHFVIGGAVRGGDVYGRYPAIQQNGPDDWREGTLIPTTSVDQYGATLARWMGVAAADLPVVFPNIARFSPTTLGFL